MNNIPFIDYLSGENTQMSAYLNSWFRNASSLQIINHDTSVGRFEM